MTRRLAQMAERAGRTRSVREREARTAPADREDLRGRVLREAEWLDPGLGRRPPEGEQ